MHDDLVNLINIAGAALQEEDRRFRNAIAKNQLAYPNENPGAICGILRLGFNNEHYYQFLVARALIDSYQYRVDVEKNYYDLVISYPGDSSRWFAIVEMKRWMTGNGEIEIPGILYDISTKLVSNKAEHNLMLLFSSNPHGQTVENHAWLATQLRLAPPEDTCVWNRYSFPTYNIKGKEFEFWVAGYEVPQSIKPSTTSELTTVR
jgi:hypothetical protein